MGDKKRMNVMVDEGACRLLDFMAAQSFGMSRGQFIELMISREWSRRREWCQQEGQDFPSRQSVLDGTADYRDYESLY